MNRRQFLRTTSLITAGAFMGARSSATGGVNIEVIETRSISHQPHLYHGWPTLARRRNGHLLLAYSGGREAHVCPFGRVELMVSSDEGRTWGWPQVLMDSAIDDRDAGVLETARGTILVTTFTSLAYEPILERARQKGPVELASWPQDRLTAWQAAHERLNSVQRRAELGQWMIRSTDAGRTWSARYSSVVNSPHGPLQLRDGRLLYAGVELWADPRRVGVCDSLDDGQTWRWLADIPARDGDELRNYHELHAVETADNRILVHIRNHNKSNSGETLQTESADGGKTWSQPQAIGVWGLPSFLLRLRNDHLLMTYGYRRPPYGNQACLSTDHGRTWSAPLIISADGAGGDLGYPSTVELEDGSLLTIWYEVREGSPRAMLRQARWRMAKN